MIFVVYIKGNFGCDVENELERGLDWKLMDWRGSYCGSLV